jgi:hypothetical protein
LRESGWPLEAGIKDMPTLSQGTLSLAVDKAQFEQKDLCYDVSIQRTLAYPGESSIGLAALDAVDHELWVR